jgi:periplasmic protein TonB
MLEKTKMNKKIITASITCIFIAISSFTQQPENTVTFKVRKKPTQKIEQVEIIPAEIRINDVGVWFVEEQASFQGGDISTFNTWVKGQVRYPYKAVDDRISGKVVVQFSVNREGKIVDVKIIKSVHPLLDSEALRVIQSSPRWTPAKQSGNAVTQNFVFPVTFTLQ